jgi:hypothetical protein
MVFITAELLKVLLAKVFRGIFECLPASWKVNKNLQSKRFKSVMLAAWSRGGENFG